MSNINIISLNIEHDCHLKTAVDFFKHQNPDVILLQEIFEEDLSFFEATLNMTSVFTGLNYLKCHRGEPKLGLATLSRLPIISNKIVYYSGSKDKLPTTTFDEPEKMARAILITEVKKNDLRFFLINLFFTWSANATPTPKQLEDLNALLPILASTPEFVMCGDLNSPRGKIIFNTLAEKYKDNIPTEINTTIDKQLHRAGDLNIVVDCLFTTPTYQATNIKVISGISDHCAVTANIIQNPTC